MAPSFPSERKRVKSAEDRSPDLRLFQPPSQVQAMLARLQWSVRGPFAVREYPWLKSCLGPVNETTRTVAGALTVAGQWRSFTAFPSILTIAVLNCAAPRKGSLYAMEQFSMSSTFIAGLGLRSQSPMRPEPLRQTPKVRKGRIVCEMSK